LRRSRIIRSKYLQLLRLDNNNNNNNNFGIQKERKEMLCY
jgi:hypothetical protein